MPYKEAVRYDGSVREMHFITVVHTKDLSDLCQRWHFLCKYTATWYGYHVAIYYTLHNTYYSTDVV